MEISYIDNDNSEFNIVLIKLDENSNEIKKIMKDEIFNFKKYKNEYNFNIDIIFSKIIIANHNFTHKIQKIFENMCDLDQYKRSNIGYMIWSCYRAILWIIFYYSNFEIFDENYIFNLLKRIIFIKISLSKIIETSFETSLYLFNELLWDKILGRKLRIIDKKEIKNKVDKIIKNVVDNKYKTSEIYILRSLFPIYYINEINRDLFRIFLMEWNRQRYKNMENNLSPIGIFPLEIVVMIYNFIIYK